MINNTWTSDAFARQPSFMPRTSLRSRLLAFTLLAIASVSPAYAQRDTDPASPPVPPSAGADEIVVTGEAYAIERSIDTKRKLNVISDSISASEIGAIPEFGLGEALQRVPGVSFVINNGRGEAQFMTLRGLNSDYNSVTIDGIQLPSTEETRRVVSFDVIPSFIVNQATVYKTYRADLPSDAVAGVTELRTPSAFDHDGLFVTGHGDYAYWQNRRMFRDNPISGQADVRISDTFGSDNQFGAILVGSYYRRISDSLNSYTLPYSFYSYAGGTQTVTATPLTPTTNVTGLVAIPDRRRTYFYDNVRERPAIFGKFEWRGEKAHAELSGGFFEHRNNEQRYSAYLNRGPAMATFSSPTDAMFATGQADSDFDHYEQYRNVRYIQLTTGYDFDATTRLDVTGNYGRGFYRQNTTETVFLTPTNATFGATFAGNDHGVPLLVPNSPADFANTNNYLQSYYLTAVDSSRTREPQVRIDLVHGVKADEDGLTLGAGYNHRELRQTYFYNESRFNPLPGAVTLTAIAPLQGTYAPYNFGGVALPYLNGDAATAFLNANPQDYTVAASNLARSTLNNFQLNEIVNGIYAEASYRAGRLFAQAGFRYEWTGQDILNYQPNPITSTTSFAALNYHQDYAKPLPEVNVTYDVSDQIKLRGAVSQTIARARFADLAQNQSLTLSGTVASESIANPNLQPRTSVNYDLSLEYYPIRDIVVSAAGFYKAISNEIFALTNTQQNVSLPGLVGNNYTLITTESVNAGNAKVYGVELGANVARLPFLRGWAAGFGGFANVTFIGFDAPTIQMADGVTYRKLPQLLESTKLIANAAIIYRYEAISAEVAYNHTGKMPTSFDRTSAVNDQWYAPTNTIDAQVAYRIRKGLELRVQAKNLTNEPNRRVVGPYQNLNFSLLQNGAAYYAGVSFSF